MDSPVIAAEVRQLLASDDQMRLRPWLALAAKYACADPDVYHSLVSAVDDGFLDEPTFQLTETTFRTNVETVRDLKRLHEAYLLAARDYKHLREPLIAFQAEVEELQALYDADLREARTSLEVRERRLKQKQLALDQAWQELDARLQPLDIEYTNRSVAEVRRALDAADAVLAPVEAALARWRIEGEPINEAVHTAELDPIDLWASQSLDQELHSAQKEIESKSSLRDSLQGEFEHAEQAQNDRRQEVEGDPRHAYAVAYDRILGVASEIETFLELSFDGWEIEGASLTEMPLQHSEKTVDIFTPLSEGVRAMLRSRCSTFYRRVGREWESRQITAIYPESGEIEVDGLPRRVRVSRVGTGVEAAMTVRSLSVPIRPPARFSVLLTDEWGQVAHRSLAQAVYADLASLSDPVIAIFTQPTDEGDATLVEAQVRR